MVVWTHEKPGIHLQIFSQKTWGIWILLLIDISCTWNLSMLKWKVAKCRNCRPNVALRESLSKIDLEFHFLFLIYTLKNELSSQKTQDLKIKSLEYLDLLLRRNSLSLPTNLRRLEFGRLDMLSVTLLDFYLFQFHVAPPFISKPSMISMMQDQHFNKVSVKV